MTLTLPYPPRTAFLRSLWIVLNVLSALILGAVTVAAFGPVWLLPTAVLFVGLALLGYRWSEVQVRMYRAWNRAAGRVRKTGFQYMLFLTHRLLLKAIGREGSQFDAGVDVSSPTRWSSYPAAFRSGSPFSGTGPIEEVAQKSWIHHYLGWVRSDGNHWASLLLPFLIILSLFSNSKEDAKNAPSKIYTLF